VVVIVLTAQSIASEEKALNLGAHDYLTKPVPTRSVVARLRAVRKRINTRPCNYLPDDQWPDARGERPSPKPLLACFLPPDR
jgi:DNA-binding response OmpR family regulator